MGLLKKTKHKPRKKKSKVKPGSKYDDLPTTTELDAIRRANSIAYRGRVKRHQKKA